MRHVNPNATIATDCIAAVRSARDPTRLQQVPAEVLVTAAAVLAKTLVSVIDSAGLKPQRAQAMNMIDATAARSAKRYRGANSDLSRRSQSPLTRP